MPLAPKKYFSNSIAGFEEKYFSIFFHSLLPITSLWWRRQREKKTELPEAQERKKKVLTQEKKMIFVYGIGKNKNDEII